MVEILTIKTSPIEGQKPGTSGLRKKTAVFEAGNYLPNFVQATFNCLQRVGEEDPSQKLEGSTIVVGGDGRYFNDIALSVILKMACANGVKKVIVGTGGIFCTPALSAVIREKQALGGFILTASHNPGGKTEDWGIKYNGANGGPAQEKLTEAIFDETKNITEYRIVAHASWPGSAGPGTNILDLNVVQCTEIPGSTFAVEVVDPVSIYEELLKEQFDFAKIKKLFENKNFEFTFDALNAVTGPYAKRFFDEIFACDPDRLIHCEPMEDFGGLHPDPNLKYASELVKAMGCTPDGVAISDPSGAPDFGAASDGDGDRNMVMGRGFFVSPSDSVAVIAANYGCIKAFEGGLKGVARSMPTSGALDLVAQALKIEYFVTPTGWKFFGNLMDAGKCSICGEESFGTGSDHVREKDGLWAVLAWLSILADKNKDKSEGEPLVSVKDIVLEHWGKFGRNYYTRYDYEGVTSEAGAAVMEHLRAVLTTAAGQSFSNGAYVIDKAEEFEYTDPIDGSVSKAQGIIFTFQDGSRVIFRLSGTGSSGATIRMYVDRYVLVGALGEDVAADEMGALTEAAGKALADLIDIAIKVADIEALTGRTAPSVIT